MPHQIQNPGGDDRDRGGHQQPRHREPLSRIGDKVDDPGDEQRQKRPASHRRVPPVSKRALSGTYSDDCCALISMLIRRDQVELTTDARSWAAPILEAKLATLASRAAGVGSTTLQYPRPPSPSMNASTQTCGVPLLDFEGPGDRVDGPPLESTHKPRRDVDGPQHERQRRSKVLAVPRLAIEKEILHRIEFRVVDRRIERIAVLAAVAQVPAESIDRAARRTPRGFRAACSARARPL